MPKLIELRRAFFTLVALLLFAASAAAAPACGGRDLIADMKDNAPQSYTKLLNEAGKIANGEGLLWRIEKAGVAPSHLFGTIHITDPRVTNLPAPVRAAIKASTTVAVESVEALDRKRMEKSLETYKELMFFRDGETISQHLGEPRRKALIDALAGLGIKLEAFGAMKPWVVISALGLPACEVARHAELAVVDKIVADMAQEAGIALVSLETVEEQFTAFDSIPLDLQVENLIASVRLYPRLEDLFATMAELYLQRRIAQFQALSDQLSDEVGLSQEGDAAFMEMLVEKRNKVMASRAVPLIDEGATFIAVGALHLIGETGLVQALREKGYEVTRVY